MSAEFKNKVMKVIQDRHSFDFQEKWDKDTEADILGRFQRAVNEREIPQKQTDFEGREPIDSTGRIL